MRVSVGDLELFVEVAGEGPAFVIGLHGRPGLNGSKLRYQLAPVAESAQVVVPDQRGHGRSDRGGPETWNLDAWAADVKSLAEALEIARPVVLGVSFGGFVAQRYAAMYPGHPAALILISTSPRLARREETTERLRHLGGEQAVEVFNRAWDAQDEQAEADWRRVIGPLMSRRKDPEIDRLGAERIETIEASRHFVPEGKAMDLRAGLAAVRCPTLVVVGELDPLVPAHLAGEIVEAIPDGLAKLEMVSDASHDVFADNGPHSYRVIREFLQRSATPTKEDRR